MEQSTGESLVIEASAGGGDPHPVKPQARQPPWSRPEDGEHRTPARSRACTAAVTALGVLGLVAVGSALVLLLVYLAGPSESGANAARMDLAVGSSAQFYTPPGRDLAVAVAVPAPCAESGTCVVEFDFAINWGGPNISLAVGTDIRPITSVKLRRKVDTAWSGAVSQADGVFAGRCDTPTLEAGACIVYAHVMEPKYGASGIVTATATVV